MSHQVIPLLGCFKIPPFSGANTPWLTCLRHIDVTSTGAWIPAKSTQTSLKCVATGWLNSASENVHHLRVDHRRADIAVAEQFLDAADVRAGFQQMRGERMPPACGSLRAGDPKKQRTACFMARCKPSSITWCRRTIPERGSRLKTLRAGNTPTRARRCRHWATLRQTHSATQRLAGWPPDPVHRVPANVRCAPATVAAQPPAAWVTRSLSPLPLRTVMVPRTKSTSLIRNCTHSISRIPVRYSRRAINPCVPSKCANTR